MPGVPTPPGFIRPDPPAPGADKSALNKSNKVTFNDGTQKAYPTLDDYVQNHVAEGRVADLADLVQNHAQYVGEIFFNWIRHGQLGCLFAVQLSKNPRENRWFSMVHLNALSDGSGLGGILNTQLDAAAQTHEAAAVIFPDITSEAQVVELVNALCGDGSGRWYRTDDGITPDPNGSVQMIGLRWVLPSGKSVNYVLGFAPLATMPLTRRSPFTALFLRILDAKLTPEHKEDGRVQVHLADLDSGFGSQERHNYVHELTMKTRGNQVEPHMDTAAKARVTFSVSPSAGAGLIAPRHVVIEKDDDAEEHS